MGNTVANVVRTLAFTGRSLVQPNFLHEVHMFSDCVCGFFLANSVSSHSPCSRPESKTRIYFFWSFEEIGPNI